MNDSRTGSSMNDPMPRDPDKPIPFIADPFPMGDAPPSCALPAQEAHFNACVDQFLRMTHDTEDWSAADWRAARIVGILHFGVGFNELRGDDDALSLRFGRAFHAIGPALMDLTNKHRLVATLDALGRDCTRRFSSYEELWATALEQLADALGSP